MPMILGARWCGAVAGVSLALSGCGASTVAPTENPGATPTVAGASDGGHAPADGGGIDMTPQFDENLGRVILPYDRFAIDNADSQVLQEAFNVRVAICARRQGIDFVALPMIDNIDVYRGELFFGPWTLAQAQKFGFVEPMRDADLRENGIVPADYGQKGDPSWKDTVAHNAPIIDKYSTDLDECAQEAQSANDVVRAAANGPWGDELAALQETLSSDEAFLSAVEDLEGCLRENGLEPIKGMPGYVEGYDVNHITEEQIVMAVQTVTCKHSVDFTRRVAAVWSALQAPVLTRYASEIVAQGTTNSAALDDAWSVINNNKDVLSPLP